MGLPTSELPYFGVFQWQDRQGGLGRLERHPSPPDNIPCPDTGRSLRIATIQASTRAICPACSRKGDGGFVSFVADLRLAYACPSCRALVWIKGA
jgi:hypothetical protein